MKSRPAGFACAMLCLGASGWATADALQGRVRVLDRNQAVGAVENVVVYYRPAVAVAPTAPAVYQMATRNKRFEPPVLVVPVGATVNFPNHDPILHNVFSSSRNNRFDVGLYAQGQGKSHRFAQAGLVRVFCNVHQSMVGHVLVLDTPFFTVVQGDGKFAFERLPAGEGALYVWHERAQAKVISLHLPVDRPVQIELPLTRRKVPSHKNKFGKSYRARRDRRERY